MGREITTTPFAVWLDGHLNERGWGVRTLAKRINPEQPEIARRALNRYLYEGAKPTPAYVTAIAAALEVAETEVPQDVPASEEGAPSGDRFRPGSGPDVREADAGNGAAGRGAGVRTSTRGSTRGPVKDAA